MRICIIGDGAMGTVCAQILSGKKSARPGGGQAVEVTIWGRSGERIEALRAERENRRYLPGVALSPAIRFEADAGKALDGSGLILCAVPTQYIHAVFEQLRPHIPEGVPIVSVAKGIEIETLRRPSEIILHAVGTRAVGALSGPNIAGELARKLPATMVIAAESAPGVHDERLAREVQELFTTHYLRVYRNEDLLGVELAGALKNVVAIAAGILDGMRAGHNAKAALLTRGLVEITRLGVTLGAHADTFDGLAGVGDLITTCFSPEGRNRRFGERIGCGESVAEVLGSIVGVVEGMPTCKSVVALAAKWGVEMPISSGLHGVLFEGRNPRSQLADLMSREPKRENSD
jgi:glycerol-3-phosphate dehydrogenase (NAD(P)+)